jgi:hypothetical protein
MKSLRKTLTLILAAVFIYSAVGHAIVMHYCNHSKEVCESGQACCSDMEKSPCHENNNKSVGDFVSHTVKCCEISNQYLVNPFAVRQPDQKQQITATEISLIYIRQSFTVSSFSENSQPLVLTDLNQSSGRDILLDCNVLVI